MMNSSHLLCFSIAWFSTRTQAGVNELRCVCDIRGGWLTPDTFVPVKGPLKRVLKGISSRQFFNG